MSMLTALLGAYGGYQRGRDTAYQRALEEQQSQQEQERIGIEREQAASSEANTQSEIADRAATRRANNAAQGLDENGNPLPMPTLPKALTQILPLNHGVGTPTMQDKTQHLLDLSNFYATSTPPRPDLAAHYLAQAKELGDTLRAQAIYGLDTAKVGTETSKQQLLAAQTAATRDLPQRMRAIAAGHDAASIQRAKMEIAGRAEVAQYNGEVREWVTTTAAGYRLQGIDATTATQRAIAELNNRTRAYERQIDPRNALFDPSMVDNAVDPTTAGIGSPVTVNNYLPGGVPAFPGAPGAPPVYQQPPNPNQNRSNTAANPNAEVASRVARARTLMATGVTAQQIHDANLELVKTGRLTPAQAAEIDRQLRTPAPMPLRPAQAPSIDYTRPNPLPIPPPGGQASAAPFRFASPTQQAEFTRTTPAMQSAAGVLAPYAPDVTSVLGGPHKGAAHGEGRAIDVGAFGGTAVGFNAPTWNAVMQAIASRRFQAIGTILEIVNNPAAQQWARANGVDLFEDDARTGATGPHVHFQVGA